MATTQTDRGNPASSSIELDRLSGLSSGAAMKGPVKAIALTNITLNGEQTIDGVACVANDRVAAAGQTDPKQNGIWIVATGEWVRAADFSRSDDVVKGTSFRVTDGTAFGVYVVTSSNPIVFDTSNITIEPDDSVVNTSNFALLNAANIFLAAALTIQYIADGNTIEPIIDLFRDSPTPAVPDVIGGYLFSGRNSAAEKITYADILASIRDATDGTEDGRLSLRTIINGAIGTRFKIDAGMSTSSTSDMGAETINALGLYINGVAVSTLGGTGAQALWLPAGAFVPQVTNGPAAGVVELSTNKQPVLSLDFDQTTQEFAVAAVVFPERWDLGTITFKPVWSADSGSGTVHFLVDAVAVANDDPLDAAYGTAQSSQDTLTATGDQCTGPVSSAITIAGTPGNGDLVWLRISRDVANDTLNADAKLLGVVIYYTADQGNDA